MGMFTRTLQVAPFGNLSAEGQSKTWETTLDVPPLGYEFFVRIWGTKSGPAPAQVQAFSTLLKQAAEIKNQSAAHAIDYLNECGIIPAGTVLTPATLWQALSPDFIEVCESVEYTAGSGKPGEIAITLGFGIPWDNEHLLHIGTLDGRFDSVYSE